MNGAPPDARGTCAHCGLPARSAAGERAFCCTGCFTAHYLTGGDLEGHTDRLLGRLVLSAFLAMGVMVFSLALYGRHLDPTVDATETARAMAGLFRLGAFALTTPILLLLGLPNLAGVVALRRYLSADALVVAGTLSAFAVSTWNTFATDGEVYYDTAAMVLVLFTFGKWMDARARERARQRLSLEDDSEAEALVLADGGTCAIAPEDLAVGDLVRARAGAPLAVDGTVESGEALVDASRLTGEADPRIVGTGDLVHAGTTVLEGSLDVRATAVKGARLRDEMEELLTRSLEARVPLVGLADRVAAVLLPAVLVLAVGTAWWHWVDGPERALLAALSVVLIACPCALGVATPLAFWTALGTAWRRGVLVRGGDVFERLARARRVFFDKTGTLTTGRLELARTTTLGAHGERDLLRLAAALEAGADHPIARAVLSAWRADASSGELLPAVEGRQLLAGRGLAGTIDGRHVRLERGVGRGDERVTRVALWIDGTVEGELLLEAEERVESAAVVAELTARGLQPRVLTGDACGPAHELGRRLGLPVEAELLPADKVAAIEASGTNGSLFVGDGLNDAAALAAADVGIAVEGASSSSLRAADVTLLRATLSAVPELLDLADRTVRVARTNLLWAFAYNAVGLGLATAGRLSPIFAASAMVVSSALVVLNSSRLIASPPAEGSREPDPLRPSAQSFEGSLRTPARAR